MSRRLWVAGWVTFGLSCAATIVSAVLGIWLGSGRLVAIAGVLTITNIIACTAMWFWTIEARPERNLPRADRRRIREHERQARVQAEIERLDRELGLTP